MSTETILETRSINGHTIEVKKLSDFPHLVYVAVNGDNVNFMADPAISQYTTQDDLEDLIKRVTPPALQSTCNVVEEASVLFDYLWGIELQCREPYGDPENGPSADDIYYPVLAKQVWKQAYGSARKIAQGMDPWNPHPKEPFHIAYPF